MNLKILLATLVIFGLIIWPANIFDHSQKVVVIPVNSSAKQIESTLKQAGVLPCWSLFRVVVTLLRVQDRLKAGAYQLSLADSLAKIIIKLVRNQTLPPPEIKVTFPEGLSIYKMGKVLEKQGFKRWREFQELTDEGITPQLRENHWGLFKYIPTESLEGYLFPDTYQLDPEASIEVVVEPMIKRFEQIVNPIWDKAKSKTQFSLHEILTVASIIEKEAQLPAERKIIASVFYNRLKQGLPLEACPTIKYALERPTKIVYLDQLNVKSPYNTYKHKGLPPGPICNPGLESIKAAFFPAQTNYYYFLAKKDGSHAFSATWQEHQKARRNLYVIPTR